MHRKDYFISYAGEDKRIAVALASALKKRGLDIWYAPWELKAGDGLRRRIDDGLSKSRFGIVILSRHFFAKRWTKYELNGLKQLQRRGQTRIVPVWHGVDESYIAKFSRSLVDIVATDTKFGTKTVAKKVAELARQGWVERLTPEDPQETPTLYEKWLRFVPAGSGTIADRECAWVYRLENGISVDDIELRYTSNARSRRYDQAMPKPVRRALEAWRPGDSTEKRRLSEEPLGSQVRLEGVEIPHGSLKLVLSLTPTRFLYYRAVQARLWEPSMRSLRGFAFDNSLEALTSGEPFLLPSNFAIHMGVVSKEGMALLRQRTAFTPLYPSAWEAGVGEFMHGPRRTQFRHFDSRGRPSLALFLQKAVEEELKYDGAKPSDFRIFGFAIEYRTLAPKLLVVYRSTAGVNTLLKGARQAADRSPAVEHIKLTPKELVRTVTDSKRFPTWGPTSKLILSLALMQTARPGVQRQRLVQELSRLTRGT